jgi:membrane-associated protease RseP (regulator of RpoE activity)
MKRLEFLIGKFQVTQKGSDASGTRETRATVEGTWLPGCHALQFANRLEQGTRVEGFTSFRLLAYDVETKLYRVWVLGPSGELFAHGTGKFDGDRFILTERVPSYPQIGIRRVPGSEPAWLIEAVTPGSGAEKAGLRKGDVIVRMEGRPIADLSDDERARLLREATGGKARLTIRRDGKEQELTITLLEVPASTNQWVFEKKPGGVVTWVITKEGTDMRVEAVATPQR